MGITDRMTGWANEPFDRYNNGEPEVPNFIRWGLRWSVLIGGVLGCSAWVIGITVALSQNPVFVLMLGVLVVYWLIVWACVS